MFFSTWINARCLIYINDFVSNAELYVSGVKRWYLHLHKPRVKYIYLNTNAVFSIGLYLEKQKRLFKVINTQHSLKICNHVHFYMLMYLKFVRRFKHSYSSKTKQHNFLILYYISNKYYIKLRIRPSYKSAS